MRVKLVKNIAAFFALLVVVVVLLLALLDLFIFPSKTGNLPLIQNIVEPEPTVSHLRRLNDDNSPSVDGQLPSCSRNGLLGDLQVDPTKLSNSLPTFEEIAKKNPQVQPGGVFRPAKCLPENSGSVAVIIPFRNRETHLRALLDHLHPILQRQRLSYQIFVVEQDGNDTFNKAVLMNAAFKETRKMAQNFSCYIFHDVDLLLENDRAVHACGDLPIHLSEYIDKFGYESFTQQVVPENGVIFGGVVSINPRVFEIVNGYSNIYFGWGGEDEDIASRLRLHKFRVKLPDFRYYRYKMFKHPKDERNPQNSERFYLMKNAYIRMYYDGLNSLVYKLSRSEQLPTYTRLLVSIDREKILNSSLGTHEKLVKSWWDSFVISTLSFLGL